MKQKERVKFFKEVDLDTLALLPTIALTNEPGLKSIQFYFLFFRIAIVWGDI